MPVVSPSRYNSATSSALTSGSFRSSLNNPTSLDKPYYRSNSGTYVSSTIRTTIGDRTTEYRSRYSDVDGKRERKSSLVEYSRNSRAPSVTESDSGTTRYRSERSESRTRDISTSRSENGKANNDSAARQAKRNAVLSSAALAMSTAELYNKYSPANYIPLTQRIAMQANQNNGVEIARSKSISNDIGRPPASERLQSFRKSRNSTVGSSIAERPEGRRSYKELSPTPSYVKRNSLTNGKDTNGNEMAPSVSEIRKRFDPKMTVTKLPTNDPKYSTKTVDQYLNQLKTCENGTTGYTKILPKDDQPVPVHLPSLEKNGIHNKWEISSSSSRSNSNSDISLSKTLSEPVSIKPYDRSNDISVSLTAKLPSDRLASIKSQLDPNNPLGKILEKSTVISVENGDANYKDKRRSAKNSPEITLPLRRESIKNERRESIKNEQEKPGLKSGKHTTNFSSYIQMSQPVASGTFTPKLNETKNNLDETKIQESHKVKNGIKFIDSDIDDNRLVLEHDSIDSPSGTGFENKTFEHENFLIKRNGEVAKDEKIVKENGKEKEIVKENGKERQKEKEIVKENGKEKQKDIETDIKPMETSTDSTISDPIEDISPETPKIKTEAKDSDLDDSDTELSGGRSGASGLRRSSERTEPISEAKSSSHASGLNGLRNIGNTCFMNSVLQCLSNTRPLLEYITEDKWMKEINTTLSCMKGALIKAFASVIKELWRTDSRDSVVNTTSLKSQVQRFAPRFMGYSQQDAQEFLRYLLEGLHEDVNRVTVKPTPIITEIDDTLSDTAKAQEAWSRYLRMESSRVGDIFVGQLKSTLRCTHCQHDSVTFDPFWDLSLPIPSRTGSVKLQQCLSHFTKEEEMDGDEKPTCSRCGVRRKCLKWFTVQKFPTVLVVHLKRFSPLERFRGKLSCVVEFPLSSLDMSPYAADARTAPTYNLCAVSNHSGTTYSGHYTAYCKHPYNGAWHEYNDSRVSPINARDVVSSEAYVLFYEMARS